jgi:hypothetical protein
MFNLLKKCLNSTFLWPAIALVIAINLWLGIKAGGDNLLENPSARWGIVSLEMAGTTERTKVILQSWTRKSPEGTPLRPITLSDIASRSLIYDYFFMIFYTGTLAMACLISATVIETRHQKLKSLGFTTLGTALARMQVLILILDALENIALWRMLRGSGSDIWPVLAKACAIPKFGLIAATLAYILFVFVIRLGESKQRTRNTRVPAT